MTQWQGKKDLSYPQCPLAHTFPSCPQQVYQHADEGWKEITGSKSFHAGNSNGDDVMMMSYS